jgi:PKD repeat protein
LKAHCLARRVLVIALPLAAMAITSGHSVISTPPVGTAAAVPGAAGPLRRPNVKSEVLKTYGRLPLQFETNLGQTDSTVKFLARGAAYTVFLTPREAVLVLDSPRRSDETHAPVHRLDRPALERRKRKTAEPGATVVRLGLTGSNPNPEVVGLEPLPGKTNYFIGNDPQKWRTGIPTYAKVAYREVYPGVDVVYYGAQRQLEYDFVVAPGADPTLIRLAVTGAETLRIDGAGDLVLQTANGALRLHKPVVYQETGTARQKIIGGYVLLGRDRVGFRVAAYDTARPLVIDPVLSYSTYLGGSSYYEHASSVAVDSAGNAYVTGDTQSPDFPTANALQSTAPSSTWNAFVAKIDSAGSALVYSTYLGGSGFATEGTRIAVDGAGNAYVTGSTDAWDFPTVNALQPTRGGLADAFVAKLNPTGSALVYSTYLGGSDVCDEYGSCYGDFGSGIAVDSAGNAYVVGVTYSSDFPTVNALQPTLRGSRDAFVAKLNPAGSALVYSTYLGGTGDDFGAGIAVDSAGNAYVVGTTWSSDFPTVNALQPTFGGGWGDAFVAKIDPTTMTQPPVASFTSTCIGLTCALDGASSSDPDGTIVGYSWNFGDGTIGSGRTVNHLYAAAGTYTVELTVTDNAAATGTQSRSVTVNAALSSLNLNPDSVAAGNTSSGTVTLSAVAPAGGAVIALASSNTAVASVPTSVTVTPEATSATFTVSTRSLSACASAVATISATYGGVTKSAELTVTPAADTVTSQQADYFANKRQLRVGAKSTSLTATLQVYVTSTGALIGTLQNLGDGRYTGQFTWPVNPQSITIRSSLCGSATKTVTAK